MAPPLSIIIFRISPYNIFLHKHYPQIYKKNTGPYQFLLDSYDSSRYFLDGDNSVEEPLSVLILLSLSFAKNVAVEPLLFKSVGGFI